MCKVARVFPTLVIAIATMRSLVSPVRSQEALDPAKYVVHIENREAGKSKVALTGFLLKGQKGIVTALHGIIKYPDVWAGRHVGARYIGYDKLVLLKVDIPRDLALLSSTEVDKFSGTVGFEEEPKLDKPDKLSDLRVVGFPNSIFKHLTFPLSLGRPQLTPLGDLLPQGTLYRDFSLRKSPEVATDAISLTGFFQPGLSGAPILNKQNRLVGVGNGGIPSEVVNGTVVPRGLGWAIPTPLEIAKWKDPKDVQAELRRLKPLNLAGFAVNLDERGMELFRKMVDANKQVEEFARKKDVQNALAAYQTFVELQNESTQRQLHDLQLQQSALSGAVITLSKRVVQLEGKSAAGKQTKLRLRNGTACQALAIIYLRHADGVFRELERAVIEPRTAVEAKQTYQGGNQLLVESRTRAGIDDSWHCRCRRLIVLAGASGTIDIGECQYIVR